MKSTFSLFALSSLLAACVAHASNGGGGGRSSASAPLTPAPVYKIGAPYKIGGQWYHPAEAPDYDARGQASWYGPKFHGLRTANGEIFDMYAMTAAHPTLPLPSVARVTNLENGRTTLVRLNDRGPFARGRIIDLSMAAADALGFKQSGVAEVRVEYVGPARLSGGLELAEPRYAQQPAPARATPAAFDPAAADETAPRLRLEAPKVPPQRTQPAAASAAPSAAPAVAPLAADAPILAEPLRNGESAAAPLEGASGDETASEALVVQAASFSSAESARAAAERLLDVADAFVTWTERDGRSLYRVRIGPFNDDVAARLALAGVIEAGFADAYVFAEPVRESEAAALSAN